MASTSRGPPVRKFDLRNTADLAEIQRILWDEEEILTNEDSGDYEAETDTEENVEDRKDNSDTDQERRKTPPSGDDIEIYTDGSKIDNKVGSAIACYYFNKLVHIDSHRLEDHATVFQAEAYALYMALDYIENTNSWSTCAEVVAGNEEADKQAKLATRKNTVDSRVPRSHNTLKSDIRRNIITVDSRVPRSHDILKSDIRRNIIEEWQNEWASTTKGPQTHHYLPKVSTKIKTFHPLIIQFLSGHGRFPSYFKRFGITDNPLCDCGDVGTPDHYVFECAFTQSLRQKLNFTPSKDLMIQDPKNLHVIQQIITWVNDYLPRL
ncbi:Retrovirus-related Pol polyprotein type-1 like protein [Argiope bruennichi]|uniref:Retrovirus-related Pol polyprotein type-1 like protein n=1 Tax=Argiope bruennichi TaxID=94029 RepID=A0A8T0FDX4_ARGBR|nr:Retrovirus-related Pol polyprotein type-1 like protein [Argiope bruennichi]